MAFRALLFSKSPETNAAMTTACESTGIPAEACSDIFTAIEKAKTRAFSCVIADWSDQPEASFLLKRARESASNRNTTAIVVVDNEPTAAEMRDNRLDFLIYRPISAEEADAVLTKASENMQPSSPADVAEQARESAANAGGARAASVSADGSEVGAPEPPPDYAEADASEFGGEDEGGAEAYESQEEPVRRGHAMGLREACAVALVVVAAFCLWRSRDTIQYLARTPEGRIRVLRESAAALFYMNQSGALPVSSAGSDAQQDAYFSRGPANSDAQEPTIGIVASESSLPETRTHLPKAADFPLPAPVLAPREAPPPIHTERPAIPQSMRDSSPIAPPVVVTVNPSQMMPISVPAPQPQPVAQQFSEPVQLSEDAARALLVHSVDPVYPPEGLAQKLHGAVMLQASVGRDGTVEDLKIVRGYFILGRAAIAAVKQWRFQPYMVNGHAAATQTVITISFNYPPG